MLAQARWTNLSEADGLAWARVPGLSMITAGSMSFVCCLSWVAYYFLKYRNYMIVFVVFGLEELSPIGVWDMFDGWTHDGHGTV